MSETRAEPLNLRGHVNRFFSVFVVYLALTPERIITAYAVTSGEKLDGKELRGLIDLTEEAGVRVDAVVGDAAYSEKDNLELAKEREIRLVSRLSEAVTHGIHKNASNFAFNKDAGRYVCKAGHMSVRTAIMGKKKREKTGSSAVKTYFFDVEKCKVCPYREGCYKEGSRSKSYSVTLISKTHSEQQAYQETEEFKILAKERYKIEAKNSELKHGHGYAVASGRGLFGMQLQGAFTVFAVNMKRIFTLIGE